MLIIGIVGILCGLLGLFFCHVALAGQATHRMAVGGLVMLILGFILGVFGLGHWFNS